MPQTYHHTALVDDHEVVVVVHHLDSNQLARFLSDVKRLNALTASVGLAVVAQDGTLTKSVL